MPGKHAVLSPSAAERWIECPASIRMQSKVPREAESPYAREGTAAHALGEIKASLAFGKINGTAYSRARAKWVKEFAEYAEHDDTMAEMERHTDAYVELLQERVAIHENSQLMLEQRMATGLPDDGAGTSDAVIVSPIHIEIIDFKYGAGVAVEAEGNPQLKLYALGALDTYGDILGETEAVYMTVHQPRMDHILTAEITPESLRKWRTEVAIPRGELALGEDAPFGPSETACRWCPASGRCKAQVEAAFPDDLEEVEVETLTESEVADYLNRIPLLKEWLKAFEEQALTMLYSEGKEIPGYKVVLSGGGKRTIPDPDGLIKFLVGLGHDVDEVSARKIRGLGELEKLLGKKEFAETAKDYIKPPEGKPAIAPESDSRSAIQPNAQAAEAFNDE